jgi:hypothetical protein
MIIIDKMVPKSPKDRMITRFLIKLFFLREYPAANMMGGRIKRKKPPSLN